MCHKTPRLWHTAQIQVQEPSALDSPRSMKMDPNKEGSVTECVSGSLLVVQVVPVHPASVLSGQVIHDLSDADSAARDAGEFIGCTTKGSSATWST